MGGRKGVWVVGVGALLCLGGGMARAQADADQASSRSGSQAGDSSGSGLSIYSYEDEQGTIHFVDSLDLVPEQYRVQAAERAEKGELIGDGEGGTVNLIAVPEGLAPTRDMTLEVGGAGVSGQDESESAGATVGSSEEGEGAGKAPALEGKDYWQARIREWRDRKAAAEAELATVDEEMLRTRTLTPPGFQKKMADLEARRTELTAEIQLADEMLNKVIPEEARKAGVPPGWLRD